MWIIAVGTEYMPGLPESQAGPIVNMLGQSNLLANSEYAIAGAVHRTIANLWPARAAIASVHAAPVGTRIGR